MTRAAANRRRRDFGPLSDLEDLRDAVPELTEDFHHPCPGCGQELVIRADQPIRRVKCLPCNQVYGVDRRIGGELYLLPHHAREYDAHRSFLVRFAALRLRILTLIVAIVLVVGLVTLLVFESEMVLIAAAALIGFFAIRVGHRSVTRAAANRRRRDFGPLSDLEDLRDAVPELSEDFHHPCPGCGQALVIRADQPIRRVKCSPCNQVYGVDRRIGGELYLLPHHAREYDEHRSFLVRFAALRLRILTLIVAVVLVVGLVTLLVFESEMVLIGAAALIGFLAIWIGRGEDRQTNHDPRRRSRRKAPRRRSSTP